MKKFTSIWFDLDNTLLDFSGSSVFAFSDLMKHIGFEPKEDSYQKYHAINMQAWHEFESGQMTQKELKTIRFKRYFDLEGIDFDPLEANQFYLKRIVVHPVMVPLAETILKHFQSLKIQMLIVTNGMKEVQRPRIEFLKWTNYFHHIIVSDEINCAKPSAEYFEHAHKASGNIDKNQVLVVGDSLGSDILGANNFGVASCWHNFTNIQNETGVEPTYTIHSLEELKSLV